jgi:Kef-type K+ transport system membrane component KefB
MFFAGLEIDIVQFRRERKKSIIFGLLSPSLYRTPFSGSTPIRVQFLPFPMPGF